MDVFRKILIPKHLATSIHEMITWLIVQSTSSPSATSLYSNLTVDMSLLTPSLPHCITSNGLILKMLRHTLNSASSTVPGTSSSQKAFSHLQHQQFPSPIPLQKTKRNDPQEQLPLRREAIKQPSLNHFLPPVQLLLNRRLLKDAVPNVLERRRPVYLKLHRCRFLVNRML